MSNQISSCLCILVKEISYFSCTSHSVRITLYTKGSSSIQYLLCWFSIDSIVSSSLASSSTVHVRLLNFKTIKIYIKQSFFLIAQALNLRENRLCFQIQLFFENFFGSTVCTSCFSDGWEDKKCCWTVSHRLFIGVYWPVSDLWANTRSKSSVPCVLKCLKASFWRRRALKSQSEEDQILWAKPAFTTI